MVLMSGFWEVIKREDPSPLELAVVTGSIFLRELLRVGMNEEGIVRYIRDSLGDVASPEEDSAHEYH